MKTVLLVPGFGESISTKDYASVIAAIDSKGYKTTFVPIHWARATIDDWVQELHAEYAKHDPSQTILAGFSYGAMTAFMCAVQQNPAELWLFSFSPYFADDIPELKKAWLAKIGHRRVDAFKKLDFNVLAKSITCKTLLVIGEIEAKESPIIARRVTRAHQAIANSTLVTANNSGHDVANKNYIAAIKNAI